MKVKVKIVTQPVCAVCGGSLSDHSLLIVMNKNKSKYVCCCCASRLRGYNAFDCCESNNAEYDLD